MSEVVARYIHDIVIERTTKQEMKLILSFTELTQQSLSSLLWSGTKPAVPKANGNVPEHNCAHGDLCLLF